MNILEEIAGKTRERIDQEKGKVSVAELKERIRDREQKPAILPTLSFYQALKKEGMSYICEVKKASPSKGLIAPDFLYVEIAKEYEAAGASAISCLTEPFYFQGSDRYLEDRLVRSGAAGAVDPVCRPQTVRAGGGRTL